MRKIEVQKNNKLPENAKKLRRDMPPQEKHLWYDFLKNYPSHIKKLPSATIKCPKIGHFFIRKTFFEQAIAHELRAISYVIKKPW